MDDDPKFFDRSKEIERHGGKLPHWQQDDATVFVTFRLGDSLPKPILDKLSEFKANWLRIHGGDWTPEMEMRWKSEHAAAIDEKLDEGHGCCCLRKPEIREEVIRVLRFGAGTLYRLDAAVVMPNHVHILFAPLDGPFEKEIQAWKSVSSRRISDLFGDAWPKWQKNYYDRLIRSQRHFDRVVRYIRENGPKASLGEDEYWLYVGENGGATPPSLEG